MSRPRRPKAPAPKARKLTRTERRELNALAAKILAGEAEALERQLMGAVYGAPIETDVDPLPWPRPMPRKSEPKATDEPRTP